MGTTTSLLTVDQAREIADLRPDIRYELHQGELIQLPPPKHKNRVIQEKLRHLLGLKAAKFGYAFVECGFRGTPEYNSRIADVALLSKEHQDQAMELDEVFGAPALIIKVLSPSNRAIEIDEKEDFCLSHGCQSFWLVDPTRRTVKVTNASHHVQWFKEGDTIDLAPFAADTVSVNEIFAPLT